MSSFLLPAWTLARREVVRFLRQRNRVFGALGQPIFFWALFGFGLDASFKNPAFQDMGYREYFFPGTLVLIVLFTAIFATISIIEDRKEGFLQAVLVSPAPRSAMVLGKVLGGTALALGQALIFLLLGPVAGVDLDPLIFLQAAGVLFLIAFALTGLGFCIAWRMDSTQGFHAIMMVFLMPMWLLSGAFFPAAGAPAALAWVIRLNPLTYGLAALRRVLAGGSGQAVAASADNNLPSLGLSLAVTIAFGLAMVALATVLARARRSGAKA